MGENRVFTLRNLTLEIDGLKEKSKKSSIESTDSDDSFLLMTALNSPWSDESTR